MKLLPLQGASICYYLNLKTGATGHLLSLQLALLATQDVASCVNKTYCLGLLVHLLGLQPASFVTLFARG